MVDLDLGLALGGIILGVVIILVFRKCQKRKRVNKSIEKMPVDMPEDAMLLELEDIKTIYNLTTEDILESVRYYLLKNGMSIDSLPKNEEEFKARIAELTK